MKKNIAIIVLSVFVVFLLVYARIKAGEADMQTAQAIANLELAEQHQTSAEAAEMEATKQAAAAIIAQNKAEKENQRAEGLSEKLKKCQGR